MRNAVCNASTKCSDRRHLGADRSSGSPRWMGRPDGDGVEWGPFDACVPGIASSYHRLPAAGGPNRSDPSAGFCQRIGQEPQSLELTLTQLNARVAATVKSG
ncbi:hypothetical protein M5D96_009629 [Drosophila gunungcola]|uniref:Uncharacterized protein n=1 Tax=Drosophila gunungcola TaxID=103775 RepID=A0A9Q0BMC0_9MUSC|nr:hypothetical protein M5D96_009629 [Drosophila gunungcola]